MPQEQTVRVKVGYVGIHHPHAQAHIRTLELLEEVQSIVIWDESETVFDVLRKQDRPKLDPVRTTVDQLLLRLDIPVVVITEQNNRNPDLVIRAASAGKHVLTEKPGAASSRDMARVVNAVQHAGTHLGFYYTWRFNPIARDIRAMIQQGVLGRLMSIEARMVTSQVHFRNPSHWLFKRSAAGGGILSWLGCHWIDLLRFITQDEIVAVSAMTGTLNGAAIDVEDTAIVNMKFSKGALGTLHAGYLLPRSDTGYASASYDTYIGIRGTKGYIAWHPTATDAVVTVESVAPGWHTAPTRELRYTLPPCDAYSGQYGLEFVRHFIRSACRKDPPAHSGEDALRVLKIIEAAYQSNDVGRMVELEQG